jgi:transcriptional regulator with GAF, ATPase, and Fis domain
MASTALIGCSPKFGSLPGSFNKETLNLFDDDIISTSVFEEIVGSSEAIFRVTAQVLRVAPSNATVLITRESGTGKELPARAIRGRSNRSRLPFICCALLVMEMG